MTEKPLNDNTVKKILKNDRYLSESLKSLTTVKELTKFIKASVLARLLEKHKKVDSKLFFKTLVEKAGALQRDKIERNILMMELENQLLPYVDENNNIKRTTDENEKRIEMIKQSHDKIKSLVHVSFKTAKDIRFGYMRRKDALLITGDTSLVQFLLDHIWNRSRYFGSVHSHEPQRILRFGMCVYNTMFECTKEHIEANFFNCVKNRSILNNLMKEAYEKLEGKPDLFIVDHIPCTNISLNKDKQQLFNSRAFEILMQIAQQDGAAFIASVNSSEGVNACLPLPATVKVYNLDAELDDKGKGTLLIGDVDKMPIPKRIIDKYLGKKEYGPPEIIVH